MKRTAVCLLLLVAVCGPSHAANARSMRTEQSFRRDQYRRAVINYQWAVRFQRLRENPLPATPSPRDYVNQQGYDLAIQAQRAYNGDLNAQYRPGAYSPRLLPQQHFVYGRRR